MEENQNPVAQNTEPQFNPPPMWSREFPKGLQIILWIFVVTVLLAGGYILYAQNKIPEMVACTADAKLCPDGSSVGRIGPNCEFVECPVVKSEVYISDWKIYKNERYGFEFQYPGDFVLEEAEEYGSKIPVITLSKLKPERIQRIPEPVDCGGGGFFDSDEIIVRIVVSKEQDLTSSLWSSYDSNTDIETIGNKTVRVSRNIPSMCESSDEILWETPDNGIVLFNIIPSDQKLLEKYYERMIESFVVARETIFVDTSNWELYKNERLGIEIKLPVDDFITVPIVPREDARMYDGGILLRHIRDINDKCQLQIVEGEPFLFGDFPFKITKENHNGKNFSIKQYNNRDSLGSNFVVMYDGEDFYINANVYNSDCLNIMKESLFSLH